MKFELYPAAERGIADHGWLKSRHTFSFASYYNPERMHFGKLRVLNDDHVEAGMGFGTHPHDNMEIVSIPLEGALEHRDSMGNVSVIKEGDIQIMSAGTGVTHSEYNKSQTEAVKFLQIWIFPNVRNMPPSYDQISLNKEDYTNSLRTIVSPTEREGAVHIKQDAWFSLGEFTEEQEVTYELNKEDNGVFLFVLKGNASVEGNVLAERDAIGIWNASEIKIEPMNGCKLLLMEVPM